LSLAIGRRGQNVRLASKLVGWDIEIMTHDELAEALERAERWFGQLPNASPELANALIDQGFLSYNDITMTDAAGLAEFSGLSEELSDEIVMYAEEYSDVMERSVEDERRQAEEAAEVARVEAEEQAAVEAAAQAEAAAAEAGAAEGEAGEGVEMDAETTADANSEPAVVSSEDEASAAAPAEEEKREG
jgi:N utilization substance protein A